MTLFEQINRWPLRGEPTVREPARAMPERATDTDANVRSAAIAMATAFALVVVFGSAGMRHFARDLPANRATDVLVEAADQWHAWMQQLGPARVRPAVRTAFERLRSAAW